MLMDNSTAKGFRGVQHPGGGNAKGKGAYAPEPLTPAEVEALLGQCSATAPTGVRNRALIILLWRGGLRIAEALALKVSDVDPDRGTMRILRGKGAKARTVGLDPGAMAVVQRWIDARRARGVRNGSLICTLAGGEVSAQYVRLMLGRLAAKADIDKRVTPHQLRHSHAADLAHEGVPINVISRQLGHANSGVTARYIDHIAPAQVIDTMQRRTWTEPGK